MFLPPDGIFKPSTETEWLMEPGAEIPDLDEDHNEIVARAVDALEPRDRLIIEATFWERLSYAELGKRLGCSKPHAWRLANAAMEKLRDAVLSNVHLRERYRMYNDWEAAARASVESFDRTLPRLALIDTITYCGRKLAEQVRTFEQPSSMFFSTIACEAVAELKEQGLWSADRMTELLVRKQRDYGHQNILSFGLAGVAVRVCDKIARLENLLRTGTPPANESLLDTWLDLVGYGVIADLLSNGTFTLELAA